MNSSYLDSAAPNYVLALLNAALNRTMAKVSGGKQPMRLLPRDQNPEPEVVEQLSKVMGSTDWINQIYQEPESTQLPLFGDPEEPTASRDTIKPEWLAGLYTEQLRSLFPHVSRPVLMQNSTNSVLYALCLASHNQTAIRITNDIFNRHERLRDPGR